LKAKDIIQKAINRKRKYIRCITICDTSKFKDINMEEIEEKVNLCKEENEEDERCTF
jgi:hypothetical protein